MSILGFVDIVGDQMGTDQVLDEVCEMGGSKILDEVGGWGEVDIVEDEITEKRDKAGEG